MIRVLHISRISTAAAERGVSLIAAEPDITVRLLRARHPALPAEVEAIRRDGGFEDVRLVGAWRRLDPHRGVYASLGFGIRAARPDIIHVEEEPDSLAALQAVAARRMFAPRARLLLFTWQNVDRPKRPAVRWVLRRALRAADAIICGNTAAVSLLRTFGYRRPARVIPALALDPSIFHRRGPAPPEVPFTVGFVGRAAPEKGVDALVDAVARLGPPVRLLIAGSGPALPDLRTRVKDAGLEAVTRFVGQLDPHGVADLISTLHVLVVPSRSTPVWQEQYGRVIVEAMGCEVAVVAAASGAIPEVVGGAGVLFPEGDAEALALRLHELRNSPERRAALARAGFEHATASHTIGRRARQVVDFYREILATPSPSTT